MIKYCEKHDIYFDTQDDSECPECVEEGFAKAMPEYCREMRFGN